MRANERTNERMSERASERTCRIENEGSRVGLVSERKEEKEEKKIEEEEEGKRGRRRRRRQRGYTTTARFMERGMIYGTIVENKSHGSKDVQIARLCTRTSHVRAPPPQPPRGADNGLITRGRVNYAFKYILDGRKCSVSRRAYFNLFALRKLSRSSSS